MQIFQNEIIINVENVLFFAAVNNLSKLSRLH